MTRDEPGHRRAGAAVVSVLVGVIGIASADEPPGRGTPAAPGTEMPAPAPSAASPPPVDLLALERQPGATAPLAQVEVRAAPAFPGLDGAPGPSPAMGPPTARVKVVVFSDFQCPVCTRVVEPLKHLVRSYPDTVQVIFKHNALESHRYARQAAAASIAAFRQGKFWEYHDRLFQNQNALGEADLLRYAGEIGLDGPRFETDLKATDVAAQVAYETAMAEKLDMPGTPGFFINGERLAGWGSYSGFKGMIDRALEQAKGFQGEDAAQVATAAAGAEGQLLVELVWGAAR